MQKRCLVQSKNYLHSSKHWSRKSYPEHGKHLPPCVSCLLYPPQQEHYHSQTANRSPFKWRYLDYQAAEKPTSLLNRLLLFRSISEDMITPIEKPSHKQRKSFSTPRTSNAQRFYHLPILRVPNYLNISSMTK